MFLLPNSYLTPMQLLERFYHHSMLIKVKRTNGEEVAVLSPTNYESGIAERKRLKPVP